MRSRSRRRRGFVGLACVAAITAGSLPLVVASDDVERHGVMARRQLDDALDGAVRPSPATVVDGVVAFRGTTSADIDLVASGPGKAPLPHPIDLAQSRNT